jgi:cellobiose phosphorylase
MCRLEGADWNDGMDMADERGESCAFSAFYAWNLERLAMWIERLAEHGQGQIALLAEITTLLDRLPGEKRVGYGSWKARRKRLDAYLEKVAGCVSGRQVMIDAGALAKDLRAKARALTRQIQQNEWESLGKEGGCFNGYYDNNGKRVAGRDGRKVRMSLVGQVFPLMSGIADEEQVDTVIQTANRLLEDPIHGGMRLNTDYGACQPALGRAFSFSYGEKENGAVFSHMTVMYAFALYQRRRSNAGRAVWDGLYRMAMNQDVARIFPCLPEYFNAQGRGMYCYLTGSASWLVYLMLTQVYGVRGDCGNLRLDPQLTARDFGREKITGVTTSFAGRRLRIRYQRSGRRDPGAVTRVSINGKPVEVLSLDDQGALLKRSLIETLAKNKEHEVLVTLG